MSIDEEGSGCSAGKGWMQEWMGQIAVPGGPEMVLQPLGILCGKVSPPWRAVAHCYGVSSGLEGCEAVGRRTDHAAG